jgi:hypothetical protein
MELIVSSRVKDNIKSNHCVLRWYSVVARSESVIWQYFDDHHQHDYESTTLRGQYV